MIKLLLLASLSWASTDTAKIELGDDITLSNLGKDVRDLQNGRPVITGLPTFKLGIKFNDGTTQTTAASATTGLMIETHTVVQAFSVATVSNFGVAHATLTLTIAAGPVVVYTNLYGNGGSVMNVWVSFLVDGSHKTEGLDETTGVNGTFCNGSNDCFIFAQKTFRSLSAGSHTFAITMRGTAGTWTAYYGAARTQNEFGVFQ